MSEKAMIDDWIKKLTKDEMKFALGECIEVLKLQEEIGVSKGRVYWRVCGDDIARGE